MYLLGPPLIVVASIIIVFLVYVYFTIMLSMLAGVNWIMTEFDLDKYLNGDNGLYPAENGLERISALRLMMLSLKTQTGMMHTSLVLFFVCNIVYNYYFCASTTNDGPHFEKAVRELAVATNFDYPETEEELIACKKKMKQELEAKLEVRRKEREEQIMNARLNGRPNITSGETEVDERFYKVRLPRIPGINWGTDMSFQFVYVQDLEYGGAAEQTGKINKGDYLCQLTPIMNEQSAQNGATNTQRGINLVGEPWDQVIEAFMSLHPATTHIDLVFFRGTKAQLKMACAPGRYGAHYTSQSSIKRQIRANKQNKPPKIHNWQLLNPDEWSYCHNSRQPKPPRSHFDHVTKTLVLNMDHYCPWMFNVIGYYNYRYFFNFTWYVCIILAYGAMISIHPFFKLWGDDYNNQIQLNGGYLSPRSGFHQPVRHLMENPFIPTPDEWNYIFLAFLLCFFFCLFVLSLTVFHFRLIISAQTTIEYYGNKSRRRNGMWKNPYSAGSWKRNWEMIYGTTRYGGGIFGMFMAMLPSAREPEFLPIPFNGELVKRSDAVVIAKRWKDVESGN